MSERLRERPAENDPARNRDITVELMREFGDELDRVMAMCDPVVRPLPPSKPAITEEDVERFVDSDLDGRVRILAEDIGPAPRPVSCPGTSSPIPEALEPHARRIGTLAGIDAMHASDSATVWHLTDDERSIVLIHEEKPGDREKGYTPGATTELILVRPLGEGERGIWNATHLKVKHTFYRDPLTREPASYVAKDGRTWAQTSVGRTTGTVDKRGSWRMALPDRETRVREQLGEPVEPLPEVFADAKPVVLGETSTADFMHPSEAELRNALQALRELAQT